jgi:hypothetical protein
MTRSAPARALVSGLAELAMITDEIAATAHVKHERAERASTWPGRTDSSDGGLEYRGRHRSGLQVGYNAAERLMKGHHAQGRHLRQRHIPEICQLRRSRNADVLSGLHSVPANLAQGSGTTQVVVRLYV